MGWTVWGDVWESTLAMQNTTLFQTVQMNSDVILKAVRTWIIYIDNPVYTSLNMKIYSNEVVGSVNTPRKLLHTSTDVRLPSEIKGETNLPHGVREIYFNFDNVNLRGADKYNFVINASGYAPAGNAHLAWMKGFPDPVNRTGYTPYIERIGVAPYQIYFIGGQF